MSKEPTDDVTRLIGDIRKGLESVDYSGYYTVCDIEDVQAAVRSLDELEKMVGKK